MLSSRCREELQLKQLLPPGESYEQVEQLSWQANTQSRYTCNVAGIKIELVIRAIAFSTKKSMSGTTGEAGVLGSAGDAAASAA